MTREEARKILGIPPGAGAKEIKKAYRKKAMKVHPDHNDSPDARLEFIELHDAYEVLTSRKTTSSSRASAHHRPTYKSTSHSSHTNYNQRASAYTHRHHTHSQDWEEDVRRARATYDDLFEKRSKKIYQQFFDDYRLGWKRKVVIFITIVSAILSLVFTIDYFLPEKKKSSLVSLSEDRGYYYAEFDSRKVELTKLEFFSLLTNEVVVVYYYSPIFKDFSEVYVSAFDLQRVYDITPGTPITTFPIVPLVLLFPIISFFRERPTFNFTFFTVHINLYGIPLLIGYLLLNGDRLFRVF